MSELYIPKWHKELDIFSKIKPVLIIEGNVLDSYQYPVEGSIGAGSIVRLSDYLHYYFKDLGYKGIAFYDSREGFTNDFDSERLKEFSEVSGANISGKTIKAPFIPDGNGPIASTITHTALTQAKSPVVVVMDFSSRYIVSPDSLSQSEVDSFTILIKSSLTSKDVKTELGALKNILIMIVNKVNDLPAWYYLQNPNVKTITLDPPQKEERESFVKGDNFPSFFAKDIYESEISYYNEHEDELEKVQDRFVALTEGLSFTEINNLRRLSKNERTPIKNVCDVIDLYKYGIKENPWKKLSVENLKNAHENFGKRVKGQDFAVSKTLDVVKRAVTGMSGLQGSSLSRPKGVLFFAGPTGTGKTETAKTLAELLFGDERACIRFDMSEYAQSHSDQKLLGAPPGYVGYEAGGQLTNAVKKNPFSILLFDEIEKAHSSILDKFLQILEDGRMTDGQGNTVYFTESIIIFTSNLGIYTLDASGHRSANVTSDMPYNEVQDNVRNAIEDYFKLELGRPEILNRIGENIVVFDFIRDDVAAQILNAQIDKIISSIAIEKNIRVQLSNEARNTLLEASLANLSNGGRGIGNIVESMFINPLARYMFDWEVTDDSIMKIREIAADGGEYSIKCD